MAILGAWVYKVSATTAARRIVDRAACSTPARCQCRRRQPECVGRITGTGRLPLGRSARPAPVGTAVSLGRKYDLASGLMEITYETGAKVILQGPAPMKSTPPPAASSRWAS